LLVDRERQVIKLNAPALSMARRSAEEAVGLRGGEALRCVHASDDAEGCGFGTACETCGVRNTVLETFRSRKAFHRLEASFPYDHPAGPVDMHVLVSTTPLGVLEEDLVLVCLEDITERKRTEQEIENLARFPAESPHPILRVARDGIILYANLAAEPLLDEIMSDEGGKLKPHWRQFSTRSLRNKARQLTDIEIGGRVFSFVVVPVAEADYVNWYGRDVTASRRATEALRRERNRAQEYLDVATVMLVALDKEGTITLLNRKGHEVLGYEEEELLGQDWFELCVPEEIRGEVRPVFQALLAGEVEPVEYYENSVLTKSGEHRIIGWHGTMLRNDEGDIVGTLSSGEDVTERRRSEQEVRQLQERLAHFNRLSSMGEMVGALAHEINQPLGAIANYSGTCSMLMDEGKHDPQQLRKALTVVHEETLRAGEILRRLRALFTKREPTYSTVNVNELVQSVAKLVSFDPAMSRSEMRLDLDEALPEVQGDTIQLQQVLVNLIKNAVESMEEAGTADREVILQTAAVGDEVLVRVRDCGNGIAADQIERAFEPHYTTKADGLGMGLSICRTIIESHGGRLWATTNPDRGMTFQFTLRPRESAASGNEDEETRGLPFHEAARS